MAQLQPSPSAWMAAVAPKHSFSRHSIDHHPMMRPNAAPMSSQMDTCTACEHRHSTGPLRTAWAAHSHGTCRLRTCAYARHTHPTRTYHTPSRGTCRGHTQAVAEPGTATMSRARQPRGTRARDTPSQVGAAEGVAHRTGAGRLQTAQAAAEHHAPRRPPGPCASNSRQKASSGCRARATHHHYHVPACASLQRAAHGSGIHRAWDSARKFRSTAKANSSHKNQRTLVC